MSITLALHHEVRTAVSPSPRVCQVAAMFGLGVDELRTLTIVPPIQLTLAPGRVVFITGASGGGKTTLLRLIADALRGRDDVRLIDFAQLPTEADHPLVDLFDAPLEDTMRWLALAGLNDAFVMLRRPRELSDGQRYRLRLAMAIAAADRRKREPATPSPALQVMLADEFGATLDRLTASIIAANIRKWTTRSATSGSGGVCFIAATTHDDLLEPLAPDTLIVQHPGEGIEVMQRQATCVTR